MCGIAGFWNYLSGRPADSRIIETMTRSLMHRGPDDEGYWIEGPLALGMRRLEVVDLRGGRQPMSNEDGTVRVVFNGEVYNHNELRAELTGLGHRFRTRSDTEAIVHAFEEWGPECVSHFNGMFGLAVWDGRQRQLFLARDRLGIKPLYVFEGADGVVFGSELKAVVTAPWVPVEWDLEAVDDFLTYEFVPTPRTIVQGIRKLSPGTSLLFEQNGLAPRSTKYWRLEVKDGNAVIPDVARTGLQGRLRNSVRRRLMADVPLGAFLSGGIDSSILVALMSLERPGEVRSFSMGFRDRSYNELEYARAVARSCHTVHREQLVTPEVVGLAATLADHFDEPFGDVSAFPTYMISKLAREEITVVLSGDGGDELFAGYDHYRAHRWADRLRWLSSRGAWRIVDRLFDWLPPARTKKGPINKAKRFVEGLRRPDDLEHARWFVFWDLIQRQELYDPVMSETLRERDCFAYYRQRLAEGSERGFQGLQRQLYADVTGYLPDDILTKVDRMSMAVSLEARVPYLDHEVVEHAMAIPAERKLRGGQTKVVLRESFSALLPPLVRGRGKEGFSIPMKNWLRGPLMPMLMELLDHRRVRDRGWFRPNEVGRLVSEHIRGRENHAHRLWCLMSLELALSGLERRRSERSMLLTEVRS